MDPLKKVSGAARALKIFPLPPVILFPGTAVPLHIFEPRYRALVADALASDRVMAMAGLRPGWEAQYPERPEVSPILCAGVIGASEELPDGRFVIAVEGVVRARVISELPAKKLYREVEAEILVDPPFQGDEEETVRQAVLELAALLPQDASSPLLHQAALHGGGALADIVASVVVGDPQRRRELLEELEPAKRLRAVQADLATVLAKISAARGPANGPGGRPYLN